MGKDFNKFLLFGIDSFTGEYLVREIKKSFPNPKIYGTSLLKKNDNIFQCDIASFNQVRNIINLVKPDYIINLAALSHTQKFHPIKYYEINTIAVENILRAIDYPIKKILLPSSAAVYGQNSYPKEEDCPHPLNHYGCSKLSMENIAQKYFSHLPIIITRPFNYTGIGQSADFVLPKIVRSFRTKSPLTLGNIYVKRDFSDVRWVAKIYILLLRSEIESEIFNIASNTSYALQDILAYLQNLTNVELPISIDNKLIRNDEIEEIRGSNHKLFHFFKNAPKPIPIQETLQWMIGK